MIVDDGTVVKMEVEAPVQVALWTVEDLPLWLAAGLEEEGGDDENQ